MVVEKNLEKSTKTQHPQIFAHTINPNLSTLSYLMRNGSTQSFTGKGISEQQETKQTRKRKELEYPPAEEGLDAL